ncbi:MAG: hypothetical protein SFX72_03305 [Isosphaeraceae bacterium]|nr:hypothetical protein [Isosphaeraceae bacterium]
MRGDVAVILAAVDGERPSTRALSAFLRETRSVGGELILVDATRFGLEPESEFAPEIRRIPAARGRLVPELWAEGLRASETRWVAFSTTSMEPVDGWLEQLITCQERTDAAAVGGAITPASGLGRLDRAVYLARHAAYARPERDAEPAGDNALYLRRDLDRVASSWVDGFWEPEVHAALERIGASRVVDPAAVLHAIGGARAGELFPRRFAHGVRYGTTRPLGRTGKWRVLAAPLAAAAMAARARRGLKRASRPIRGFGPDVWIAWGVVTAAWLLGESVGIIRRRSHATKSATLNARLAEAV